MVNELASGPECLGFNFQAIQINHRFADGFRAPLRLAQTHESQNWALVRNN